MSYLQKAKQLYKMMEEGKMMEAFDQFYHDDVVIIEQPTGETRKGKEAQREAIHQWVDMVKETHGGGTLNVSSNEDDAITMVESWTDVSTAHGRIKLEEIAVQTWRGNQIIQERFYYNAPPSPPNQ